MCVSQRNRIRGELEWMAQFQHCIESKKVWEINEGQAKSQGGITTLYKSCSLPRQQRMNNVINGTHVHMCSMFSHLHFINRESRCNERDETK